MHRSRLATLLLTLSLAACTAPTDVADVPEGLVPVDLTELPELTLDTSELPPELLDDGRLSADALGDATLYLDERVPPVLVDDRPEPGGFEGAQPASLQCYELSSYPGQQVTHRALVCVPRRGGGGSLCYYTFATYTVTIECDSYLYCNMAPPNEDRCSYSVGGATYTTTRPAGDPASTSSLPCPGTGNPSACLPPGTDPFDPWGPGGGHIP